MLLGFSAVGSLASAWRRASWRCPSSTSTGRAGRRERSFFGGGVAAHVSTAGRSAQRWSTAVQARPQRHRRDAAPRTDLCLCRRPAPGHAGREPLPAPGRLPPGRHDQRARGLPGPRGADRLRHGRAGHRLRLLARRSGAARQRGCASSSATADPEPGAALLDELLRDPLPRPRRQRSAQRWRARCSRRTRRCRASSATGSRCCGADGTFRRLHDNRGVMTTPTLASLAAPRGGASVASCGRAPPT